MTTRAQRINARYERVWNRIDEAKTTMTQHTPGPWKFSDEFVHNRKHKIADVYVRPTSETEPGEMEANARLIAAAPDLLTVLQAAVVEAEADEFTPCSWLEQARAAIAKATGEQQP